ncbi:hypothetical protein Lalb_Chr16g0378001 [Lupinus albus]|uniref:Uncharacterized protein n=1 Tax=Lupinus albus TaxID=3870 RepID=A0A6A4P4Q4_LUPAL|nr:hypothetical protein Lalb_Chr16g0378001 [Lupinus albus]
MRSILQLLLMLNLKCQLQMFISRLDEFSALTFMCFLRPLTFSLDDKYDVYLMWCKFLNLTSVIDFY